VILAAAREAFAQRGYDGATIRQIATSAGVDPALVHHYFGNKEQLFAATINFPMVQPDGTTKFVDRSDELVKKLKALKFDAIINIQTVTEQSRAFSRRSFSRQREK
jgi:DNA-binding transcriptional regulator YbjK